MLAEATPTGLLTFVKKEAMCASRMCSYGSPPAIYDSGASSSMGSKGIGGKGGCESPDSPVDSLSVGESTDSPIDSWSGGAGFGLDKQSSGAA